jgi:hypothetical protein
VHRHDGTSHVTTSAEVLSSSFAMILSAPTSHHLPLSLDAILLPRCYSAPSMLFYLHFSLAASLSLPLSISTLFILSLSLSPSPSLFLSFSLYLLHCFSLSLSISFTVSLFLSLSPSMFHSFSLYLLHCFSLSLSHSQPLTCLEYIVSEALYECVVFVRLESWAVLGNNLVKALDAAVTHSLMGVKGIM